MEVLVTAEFEGWYGELSDADAGAVNRIVGLLEARGVALGTPHSSQIKGSKNALRELRVQSGGRPIRIFYFFDTGRDAVLLIAGDKTGNDLFYEEMIPRADALATQHLTDTKGKKPPE